MRIELSRDDCADAFVDRDGIRSPVGHGQGLDITLHSQDMLVQLHFEHEGDACQLAEQILRRCGKL